MSTQQPDPHASKSAGHAANLAQSPARPLGPQAHAEQAGQTTASGQPGQPSPSSAPQGAPAHTAAPANGPAQARFTLAPVVEGVALAVLLGAIARALEPFFGWWVAVPLGVVLTFSFSQLVHIALRPGKLKGRVFAGAAAAALACITSSLTYSTIYATTAATESARRDFAAKRERTQAELQRVVTTGESAQKAMLDWAQNAQAKSEAEASGGNTCPGRESNAKPGPISTWRADDAQVARTLAGQLQQHTQVAREATSVVLAMPEADDFAQVKQAYAVLNRAIEATVPLTKGGWAGPAVSLLGDRKSSQIVYPGGVAISCGDSARLALIDAASRQLAQLDQTPPLPRLAPVIDLSQPKEVTTRGIVRGLNLMASMMTGGWKGQFKDDTLMAEALKQGVFTRETAGFFLALLAEFSVLFAAMLRRDAGQAPFSISLPAWLQAQRQRQPQPSRLQGLVRAGAALLSNLFYAQPKATSDEVATKPAGTMAFTAASALVDEPESSQFGDVTLAPDPSFRGRETAWAQALLPYHHSWGDEMDYLLLPRLPETRAARMIARSLAAHNLLRCKTPRADWRDVDQTPFAMDVRDQLGDRCEQLVYEVYTVRADYAQTLRLALIEGEGGPLPQPASVAIQHPLASKQVLAVGAQPRSGGTSVFRPLRLKLLARQRGLLLG